MKQEQRFAVAAPPDRVWGFLTDPYRVAECLPGAAVTEQIDHQTYLGTIGLKLGPVAANYKGKVVFERRDEERREVELRASGQEAKGKGGAQLRLTSRVSPAGTGSEVQVTTEVVLSGILAQMGRGMIDVVSRQVFDRFAAAVRQKLEQ